MQQSCPYGSMQGRRVNRRPYRDKRFFDPLSTYEFNHYDVFHQAINTDYWGPTLVFPQPVRAILYRGPADVA
jgi:hypothetical protein